MTQFFLRWILKFLQLLQSHYYRRRGNERQGKSKGIEKVTLTDCSFCIFFCKIFQKYMIMRAHCCPLLPALSQEGPRQIRVHQLFNKLTSASTQLSDRYPAVIHKQMNEQKERCDSYSPPVQMRNLATFLKSHNLIK